LIALDKKPVQIPEINHQARVVLAKLGNNLNQIARHLNVNAGKIDSIIEIIPALKNCINKCKSISASLIGVNIDFHDDERDEK
jgi:hypothetical protein